MGGRNGAVVGEEETKKEGVSGGELKNKLIDLNDFKIIKEGEAEILMHAGNEVFYNKTQVNNRDMSIAVIRAFVSKRKQEHEAKMSRKQRAAQKISEEISSNVAEEASSELMVNGDDSTSALEEGVADTEELVKPTEVKSKSELEQPRVLEALSASGLRSLRYARKVEGLGQVVALDNDEGNRVFFCVIYYCKGCCFQITRQIDGSTHLLLDCITCATFLQVRWNPAGET